MQNSILEYFSTNEIRFHHILSTYSKNEKEFLPPETHYLYEIFILLSGETTYSINGQSFYLKPKDIIVVPPNAIHSMTFDTQKSCERMVLSFSPKLLPSFANIDLLFDFKKANSSPKVIPAKLVNKYNLLSIYKECSDICRKKDAQADLYLLGIILKFVAKLNEVLQFLSINDNSSQNATKTHSLSYMCIQYINSHLTENFSIDDMAKTLQFSVSHIRQTFKKESGLTLHNYIFIQKMQLANQLLQQGKPPVVVASELGYEYYSTFYHNYIKRFKVPPKSLSSVEYQRFFGKEFSTINPTAQANKIETTTKK